MTWCSNTVGKMVSKVMEGSDDDSLRSGSSTESSSSCGSDQFLSCAEEIRQVNILSRTLQSQMAHLEHQQNHTDRQTRSKLDEENAILRSGMKDLKNEIAAMKKVLLKSVLVTPVSPVSPIQNDDPTTPGEENEEVKKRLERYRSRAQRRPSSNPTVTKINNSQSSTATTGVCESESEFETTPIEPPEVAMLNITASPPMESPSMPSAGKVRQLTVMSADSLPDITPPQVISQYPLIPATGDAVTQTVGSVVSPSGLGSNSPVRTASDLESLSALRCAIQRYKMRCENRLQDMTSRLQQLQRQKHVALEKVSTVDAARQRCPSDPSLVHLIPHTSIVATRILEKELILRESIDGFTSELETIRQQEAVISSVLVGPLPLPPPEV